MPHCIHFGVCGGCAVDDRSAIDKAALLRAALIRAGYENPALAPLVEIPPRTRRRVDLAATRSGGDVVLGLHRARGAEVADMQECILLDPRILALLPPLRILLRGLGGFRKQAAVVINLLDNGADVLLRLDAEAGAADRNRIIGFAQAQRLPRFSIARDQGEPEPVIILQPPLITFCGGAAEPAPGAFLQASAAGEAAITAAVLAGLPKLAAKARIVELYAGIGTMTFALAKLARVEAYEGSAAAVAALERAVRRGNFGGRISTARRDLARRPLQAAELAGRAAAVLDPPYAGAAAQMRFLAEAKLPRIVYVSCNPEALGRDAFTLRKAGYHLRAATPIDQFPYSANLESVTVFDRAR